MSKSSTALIELTADQLELVAGGRDGGGMGSGAGGGAAGAGAGRSGDRPSRDGGRGGFGGSGMSGSWSSDQSCTDTGWSVDGGITVGANVGVAKVEGHLNGRYDSKTNGCGGGRNK